MAFNVKFGATDAGFTSTVKKVNESTKGIGTNVKSVSGTVKASFASMVKAGAALAIGFGAIKMAAAALKNTFATFTAAVDLGSIISDVADRTGIAADQVLILRRAFENGGLSAEVMGKSINKMQRTIVEAGQGMVSYQRAFDMLGISLDDIKDKSPADQFSMISKAIAAIQDPTQRAAAAMQIFGRSGAEMMTVFRDGEAIDTARAQLGSLPEIMLRVNATFDKTSDNLKAIKNKFLEMAAGILSEVAPALELITTLLSRIDAAAIGAKLARVFVGGTAAMKGFSDALAALKLGEFTLAFKIAFKSIKLQGAQTINSVYANFRAAISAALQFLKTAMGPGSGIWTIITSAFDIVGSKISIAFGKGLSSILKDLPFIGQSVKDSLTDNIKLLEKEVAQSGNQIKNSIGQIPDDFKRAADEASETFRRQLATAGKIVDTTQLEIGLQTSKIGLLKMQSEEAMKGLKNQEAMASLEIKAGGQRVSNAERIKELETEIKSAKAQGNEQLAKELEAQKAYYEEMEQALESGKTAQEALDAATKAYGASIDKNATKQGKVTAELQKQLTLSQELTKKAAEAAAKDKIDPGGRLEARANAAIARGDFGAAARAGKRIERRETDTAIQSAFGGGNKFGKSIQDIAQDQGIDTFRKSSRELRKELGELAKKRQAELKPGAAGKTDEEVAAVAAKKVDPMKTIADAVETIKTLVAKIEPKLPTAALGA